MAAEAIPEPVEHVGRRESAKSGAVRDLAEAIAGQIAARQDGDDPLSGSFDLDIVYNDVEYKLTVRSPVYKNEDDPGYWSVIGTRTDTESDESLPFLTFEFKDQSNWTAGAGLPLPIKFENGFEIKKLYGEFSMGSVKPEP